MDKPANPEGSCEETKESTGKRCTRKIYAKTASGKGLCQWHWEVHKGHLKDTAVKNLIVHLESLPDLDVTSKFLIQELKRQTYRVFTEYRPKPGRKAKPVSHIPGVDLSSIPQEKLDIFMSILNNMTAKK